MRIPRVRLGTLLVLVALAAALMSADRTRRRWAKFRGEADAHLARQKELAEAADKLERGQSLFWGSQCDSSSGGPEALIVYEYFAAQPMDPGDQAVATPRDAAKYRMRAADHGRRSEEFRRRW